MKTYLRYLLVFFCPLLVHAQNTADLSVILPAGIVEDNFSIYYDVGSDFEKSEFKIEGNTITLNTSFFSTYVVYRVMYSVNDSISYSQNFWVKANTKATLEFHLNNTSKLALKNSLNITPVMEEAEYIEFTAKEEAEFLKAALSVDGSENSIKEGFAKAKKLSQKRMEYIETSPDSFYTLWLFQRNINIDLDIAYLDSIFNTKFSSKQKYSDLFEWKKSKEALDVMKIRTGSPLPKFELVDINGKMISSDSLQQQGKAVLLSFWASWCGPCLKEIPFIAEVYNTIDHSLMEVISISIDKNLNDFEIAKDKNEMIWTQVHDNKGFIKSFGDYSIPKLYLADKEGKLIFVIDEKNENDIHHLGAVIKEKVLNYD